MQAIQDLVNQDQSEDDPKPPEMNKQEDTCVVLLEGFLNNVLVEGFLNNPFLVILLSQVISVVANCFHVQYSLMTVLFKLILYKMC